MAERGKQDDFSQIDSNKFFELSRVYADVSYVFKAVVYYADFFQRHSRTISVTSYTAHIVFDLTA